jgi:MerR family transcriptional regulator, heat shock protein HspR
MTVYWESESRYVISVAARIVGIEAHTLRYYERLGLVHPERSRGNIRLYSEDDIEKLRYIKTLISDCGVNVAGVEVALKLMEMMNELRRRLEDMESRARESAQAEGEETIEDAEWKEV